MLEMKYTHYDKHTLTPNIWDFKRKLSYGQPPDNLSCMAFFVAFCLNKSLWNDTEPNIHSRIFTHRIETNERPEYLATIGCNIELSRDSAATNARYLIEKFDKRQANNQITPKIRQKYGSSFVKLPKIKFDIDSCISVVMGVLLCVLTVNRKQFVFRQQHHPINAVKWRWERKSKTDSGPK